MIAYFDCFSGISGDMTLGAFIDLGVCVKWLKEALTGIPLTGFDLSVTTVCRNGIYAKSVYVHTTENQKSRNYAQIKSLLQASSLSGYVKKTSLEIFERLAGAEAKIHGCLKEDVHFHEIGGVDSIVDITGAALCIDYLGIKRIIASKIPLGKGFVSCQHGILPVPAPATLEILKGIPVYGSEIEHELVTPTGAAIIATLAESFESIPDMLIEKTGYGAGQADFNADLKSGFKPGFKPGPNLLRIITGTGPQVQAFAGTGCQNEKAVVVETCIDDMNPEFFGFLMDQLFKDGALDVYLIPIFMKKNRPGTEVKVLCRKSRMEAVIERILSETTTLGVRCYDVQRTKLGRTYKEVQTSYGKLKVKLVIEPDGNQRIVPEYEICKKIALEKNIPIRIVYDTIAKEAALNIK